MQQKKSGAGFIAGVGFVISLIVAYLVFHTIDSQLRFLIFEPEIDAGAAQRLGIGFGIATFLALWTVFLAIALALWNQLNVRPNYDATT